MLIKNIIFTLLVSVSFNLHAADLTIDNIDQNDLKNVIKEMSSNFGHSTVSSAATLGKIFGVEVGVVGGITNTPELDKLVKEVDSSASFEYLPTGNVFAAVSVPFGITLDMSIIPKLDLENLEVSNVGFGAKWTLTDGLLPLPFDLAVKADLTKTDLSFSQTSGGNSSSLEYSSTMTQVMLLASFNALILEPYFGLGTATSDGELNVTGGTNIFDNTFTTSSKASSKPSSSVVTAGVLLKLPLIRFGLELNEKFGTTRYLAKASLKF